ncbi:MAG TPA: hypothetical protein VFO49_01200 [Nocardioides sp.]|nr:hypothetical protein [Nocardioides sp.]
MDASPTEVRIEHSVADQRSLGRAFIVLYALLAVAGLVAALVKPELLLGALFFAAFVAWWAWRIRRAQSEPWLVLLTPDELRHTATGVDVRITRAEAAEVRVESRMGPRMQIQVCKVRDRDGRDLLTVSLPGRNEAVMLEAAFEEWGWPVR